MKMTPGTVVGDHVFITGPIQGVVQLEDGSVVDVSAPFIEVNEDDAEEIAHRIGLRHAAEGHPNFIERDDESGEMVQRPFTYIPTKRFVKDAEGHKVYGTPGPNAKTGLAIHPDHTKGAAFGAPAKES